MSPRRAFPWLPTSMALVAIPILLGFGVWQLQRAQWKAGLLAQFETNASLPAATPGIDAPADLTQLPFRHVLLDGLDCPVEHERVVAGRNSVGQVGYAYVFRCRWPEPQPTATDDRQYVLVNAGWSARPDIKGSEIGGSPHARFRPAKGMLVPGRTPADPMTFVFDGMAHPLEPGAPPTLDTIPDNHLSYAIQWFSFAAILAVIYGLWLRRWLAQRPPRA